MLDTYFKNYSKILPYITSKEIYVKGDLEKFHPEGLYSEIIFGSKKPYQCGCGLLKGRNYEGEICSCGVKVSDGSQRKTQFAKIKLPQKILLPVFKKSLCLIFGNKPIKNIFMIQKYMENMVEPYFYDIQKGQLRKESQIKEIHEDFKNFVVYDIYTLNMLFQYIISHPSYQKIVENWISPKHYNFVFTDEILVTPPAGRPIVVSNGSKKSIPELSKYYKLFLNRSTSSFWEAKKDQKQTEFNKNIYEYQKIADEMYQFTYDTYFLAKNSLKRDSHSGSTVEFSSRTVIVPDPAIKPYSVGLPKDAFIKMFMPNLLHFIHKKMKSSDINLDNESFEGTLDIISMLQLVKSGNSNFNIPEGIFQEFIKECLHELRMMTERAPVLWRFNFSGVIIEVVLDAKFGYSKFQVLNDNYKGPRLSDTDMYKNQVMLVNTTIAAAFNLDFDGDNMSNYSIHSEQALRDWYEAFLGNPKNIKFEHSDTIIAQPEHEAVYAMWALTEKVSKLKEPTLEEQEHLEEIDFLTFKGSFNELNNNPGKWYKLKVNDTHFVLPYNIICINKAIGFILYSKNPGAQAKKGTKQAVKWILKLLGDTQFFENFHRFNKFLLMCSTLVKYAVPTFKLKDFAISSTEITEYKKTLINEPFIGFHQNDILFTDYVRKEIAKDEMNSLHRVASSDARIKSVQLLKAASNNGIPTDIHGRAHIMNIKEDLLTGHTKESFFMSGDSARVSLAQRQDSIPKGGELQRKFIWATGFLKLARVDDCGSNRYLDIEILDDNHLETLNGRWYLTEAGIKELNSDIDKQLIGKVISFRTPIYCEHAGYKICDKCFGTKQPVSANLGASIGSYIPESIIQSVLRMHHFGGAFITKINKNILEFIKRNRFQSPNIMFINYETLENDLKLLKQFYFDSYGDYDSVEIVENNVLNTETEKAFNINVLNAPYNDDSVKQLNNIIEIIGSDRGPDRKKSLMSLQEMYSKLLQEIVLPNGIFSIYIELIMSLLYYDEDDVMLRYGKEPYSQVSIDNVITKCDPKLSIHYNLNENAISNILRFSDRKLGAEHMLSNSLKIFI